MWVVVKIMVPFWVPNIVRHLLFRVPKKEPLFWQPPMLKLLAGAAFFFALVALPLLGMLGFQRLASTSFQGFSGFRV